MSSSPRRSCCMLAMLHVLDARAVDVNVSQPPSRLCSVRTFQGDPVYVACCMRCSGVATVYVVVFHVVVVLVVVSRVLSAMQSRRTIMPMYTHSWCGPFSLALSFSYSEYGHYAVDLSLILVCRSFCASMFQYIVSLLCSACTSVCNCLCVSVSSLVIVSSLV